MAPRCTRGADLRWWLDHACEGYDRAHDPAVQHQLDPTYVGYTAPSGDVTVDENVEQDAPGCGAQSLADVRRVVAFARTGVCGTPRVTGGGPTRQTIIGTDVAGEESILLRTEPSFYDENNRLTPNPRVYYTSWCGSVIG